MKAFSQRRLNPVMVLTSLRMLMALLIPWLYKYSPVYALWLFLVAELTDLLDGYLARRYNLTTKYGALLDPLADKAVLLATIWALYQADRLPWWMLAVVFARDGLALVGAAWLLRQDSVLPANIYGKVTAWLFSGAVVCLIFWPDTGLYLMGLAIAGMVIAFISYAGEFYRLSGYYR